MNQDKFSPQPPENQKRTMSFKAAIVMTKNDGSEPTLRDVENALARASMAFAMPADPGAPIVISLNDQ